MLTIALLGHCALRCSRPRSSTRARRMPQATPLGASRQDHESLASVGCADV